MEAASIEDYESVTPEVGVDHLRDKEYEETPLPILLYGICSVTVTKDNIYTLCREDILVDYDAYYDPHNCLHSKDALCTKHI